MRVLVVDALSATIRWQFAASAGAEVVEREWTDFVDARRFALVMRADSVGTDDRRRRGPRRRAPRGDRRTRPKTLDGYRVRRTTYFCGRPLRQWRNEPLLRLFRVGRAGSAGASGGRGPRRAARKLDVRRNDRRPARARSCTFRIPDHASYRAKYERYTDAESEGVEVTPGGLAGAWAKGLFLQLPRLLFVKGAVLDGPRGIYVAYKSATYPAVVAWKARKA